jgi:outer membrane immunogenic protein
MKLTTTLLAATAVTLGLGTAVQAADLIIDEAPAYIAPVASGGNWDGVYLGAFVGGEWGVVDQTGYFPGLFPEPGADLDVSGWLVGLRAGADFTVGSGIVIGVVGDIAWSDVSGSGEFDDLNFADYADVTYELDWQGSVRGRVGIDAGSFLPYVTAGLAFGHLNHTISIEDGPVQEGDASYVGWTAGAGVEFAVADNISLNLEYRYTDLGEQTVDMGLGDFDPSFAITSHQITAGVNFRF